MTKIKQKRFLKNVKDPKKNKQKIVGSISFEKQKNEMDNDYDENQTKNKKRSSLVNQVLVSFFLNQFFFNRLWKKKDLKNANHPCFLPPQKKSKVIFLRSKKNLDPCFLRRLHWFFSITESFLMKLSFLNANHLFFFSGQRSIF